MKSLPAFLVFIGVFLQPMVSFAASDWREYGQQADHSVWVDVSSIREDKEFVYIWMKRDYPKVQYDKREKKLYSSHLAQWALDCPGKRMAGITSVLRDLRGRDVARYDTPRFQWFFEKVAPNSFGEDFLRQACQLAGSPVK